MSGGGGWEGAHPAAAAGPRAPEGREQRAVCGARVTEGAAAQRAVPPPLKGGRHPRGAPKRDFCPKKSKPRGGMGGRRRRDQPPRSRGQPQETDLEEGEVRQGRPYIHGFIPD